MITRTLAVALAGHPAKMQRSVQNQDAIREWRVQGWTAARLFSVTVAPQGRVTTTSVAGDPRDACTAR